MPQGIWKCPKHLADPQTNERCIRRVRVSARFFDGPYRFDAPDLLIGYEGGYRNSWECATGAVTETVFSDNTRAWSGDHCVDPDIVPGVMFCNRPIGIEEPQLIDIPASVLTQFGIQPPRYMKGKDLFANDNVIGMLNPSTLEQSGRPPLARAHQKGQEGSNER